MHIRKAEQKDRAQVHHLLKMYISWAWDTMENIHGVRKYQQPRETALEMRSNNSLQEFFSESFPEGQGYVAEWNGQIVGIASFSKYSHDTCELKRVFIHPNHRKKGLGKALVSFVLDEIQKTSYSKVLLDSMEFMTTAHKIYQEFGFVIRPPYGKRLPKEETPYYVFMELNLKKTDNPRS